MAAYMIRVGGATKAPDAVGVEVIFQLYRQRFLVFFRVLRIPAS